MNLEVSTHPPPSWDEMSIEKGLAGLLAQNVALGMPSREGGWGTHPAQAASLTITRALAGQALDREWFFLACGVLL